MNYSLLVLIPILLTSCRNNTADKKETENTKQQEVQLIDSLGVITFNAPARYDTAYSWTHFSDCNTCHEQKYRFQSQKDPLIKESGWAWEDTAKEVDRFTISHGTYYFPDYGNDTARDRVSHAHHKENLAYTHSTTPVIFDTLYKINDRYFSIYEIENKDSLFRKEVMAKTTIKDNEITFSCQLRSSHNDSIAQHFFESSINLINSIVIRK
jgi:hypothetical protein